MATVIERTEGHYEVEKVPYGMVPGLRRGAMRL